MTTSIYSDSLVLTTQGEQAIANANAGGLAIRPARYRVGDYTGTPPASAPSQLLGNQLAGGKLSYVQALTENTARFVFDVALTYKDGDALKRIGEILIELEDGLTFGHVVLSQPIIAVPNSLTRISLLVHTQQDIQRVLSVKLYDYTTIPSVASLQHLPSMNDNEFNAVSVLDLHKNSDGTSSPGVAYRYGQGGFYWGFSEHDRIISRELGAAFINANTFDLDVGAVEGETVIVQTIAGPGAGAVRHFEVAGGLLVNTEDPIPFITQNTVVAVWRRITNPIQPTSGIPWPQNSDVPANWTLSRGENNEPIWSPASGNNTKAAATLFVPPSKLRFSSIVTTALPGQLIYDLTEALESTANSFVVTSGVLQPRSAYFIQAEELILSGSVPQSMTLDIHQFYREPSQGHVVLFDVVEAYGDGQTSSYDLTDVVENADMIFLIVGNTFQPTTSFKLEQGGKKISTTEPVPSGLPISIYCARYEERAGWSTRIRVASYRFPSATKNFLLPFAPLNRAHLIVNVGGLPAQSQDFTLVGDQLQMNSPVDANMSVEVTLFENVMSVGTQESSIDGVVIDVLPSPHGISVIRHGQKPLDVPFVAPDFSAGKGIRIEGEYPELTVINTMAEAQAADPKVTYNIFNRNEDTEEIVVRQRINFVKTVTISCFADFAVSLGPGFQVNSGTEHIEYVLSLSTPGSPEAEYGRGVKGTGFAGFNSLSSDVESMAYANVSACQMFDLDIENHPAGFVEVVAKVRISNALVSSYGSELNANLCIKVEPR